MKIRVVLAPKDSEPQTWEFDPDDADNIEAEQLESVGGEVWDSYGQWLELMGRYNARAIRAMLWILMRRTDPNMDFDLVRFRTSELDLDVVNEPGPEGKDEAGDVDTDLSPPTTD